jgi:hypothetical protein
MNHRTLRPAAGWTPPDLTEFIKEIEAKQAAEAAAYALAHSPTHELTNPQARRRNYDRFYAALDLGQQRDPSALSIIRRVAPPGWDPAKADLDRPDDCIYELLGLKRYPLGTPYPEIVAHVGSLLQRQPLAGRPEERPYWPCASTPTSLVVDATGVGPPVVDLFRQARLNPIAVTITGGFNATEPEPDVWHVPKRDLVSVLQVLLQSRRLRIAARLPETAVLYRELQNFRARISPDGRDTYSAWREGDHDDTVLAVALACWAGERIFKHMIRFY